MFFWMFGWPAHKHMMHFIISPAPLPYLCNAKRDVAHVKPSGLPGHLAAHNGHWGGGDGQAIWGHGWQEGCGWDLACSWRAGP